MVILFLINLRSLRWTPKKPFSSPPFLSSLHTRSLLPHRTKPIHWNTNHAFVLSNPLLSLLENCSSMSHLKQIQAQMTITGLILDGLASSRLVAFCAISELGNLDYCKTILKNVQNTNAFSWNMAIRGYSESENPREAFLLYKSMLRRSNSRPDNYTYPLLLKLCARLSLFWMGHEILGHVLQLGFDLDIYVHNAVIHMLVSCGELEAGRKVFGESSVRDLVSWNSLINGYVRAGLPLEALRIYREMEAEGVLPDEVTMVGMVSLCSQLGDLDLGREIHSCIEENGLSLTLPLANALMDMYAKCGDLVAAQFLFDKMETKTMVSWTTMIVGYAKLRQFKVARRLFDEMPEKDVVPWNAMIGGYVQANQCKEALALFHQMLGSNIKPDEVTIVSLLSACSQLGALDVGIWAHHYIEKHNLSLNVALGTALVDMYAKCGNITKALQVFHDIPARNSLTWTAIIGGLALHGNAHDAISHFLEMINVGLVPDDVTFLGVLSACCHGGLVEQGRNFFAQMSSCFNLSPKLKHYSCMVDLLGRAGLLEEAEELIRSMPMEADAVVCGSLFFSCRIHGNVDMGERAARKLLELDPHDSGTYVLLANMYVEARMWEQAGKVRKMMRDRGLEKTPGCSLIEVNGCVSEFIVRDKSHPESEQIFGCLDQLTRHIELVEFVPDILLLGDDLLFGSESGI
ncbi:pentatricopeptide repeat-containing protein At2g22410, mitochondrial [Diospyros lotus]|uniref:pentatricopeptide repeat-containing protein At2g22410, mitochondrial n=1 Tax=Diospyros lotus TaxID=55363 RepID=UPI002259C3A6|nr:pentatricopeptide repeat-containing protein At2g22410, mitochondrial [Diospyros lotus]XP_052196250.1 pentatricopeptide repeat-containing protein At2g22410, mitochondrial [Diospyros lotus]XP_052196259.1 pentatricopeptide repeat-containing protein At2g22410, mitochondrial [Diospyros lotus]XP_052196270.1 pentatricopeptide repeat-containing protein At2g22410, mitochondrial [Diospyros lotus]XP_052196279.1 pentatricopeptide repeat-containing protein At2g22410, mitochondrial [Diospyros lotus]XP_05